MRKTEKGHKKRNFHENFVGLLGKCIKNIAEMLELVLTWRMSKLELKS